MNDIFLLSKKIPCRNADIFEERGSSVNGQLPANFFYNPAKLLEACELNKSLEKPPFKYIRSAGGIWEFYLMRFAPKIDGRKWGNLIAKVCGEAVPGCRRQAVGNPYKAWERNYPKEIQEERSLKKTGRLFASKLVARNCSIRQAGSSDFNRRRKAAAKAFFNYLLGGINATRKQRIFEELRDMSLQGKLIHLIRKCPNEPLFLAVGLMTCLYGSKNAVNVDRELARLVACKLESRNLTSPAVGRISGCLKSIRSKEFAPPYKSIYDRDARGGQREQVRIYFRATVWLKLLEDTCNAAE